MNREYYKPRPVPIPVRRYGYKENEGDRFFLAAPFLFGALAGGAIAASSRPRPVYVYPPAQPYYNPAVPYAHSSYSYYYPTYR